MDKLYCERSNGRWEAWFYAEGRQYHLRCYTIAKIEAYAKRYQFRLIYVQ